MITKDNDIRIDKKLETIELLAPAGDMDSFLAAVENGADAVYLGGRLFNARQSAGNFDEATLDKAIKYAHLRGVNVYLTMNTLITDEEMPRAVEFTQKAYNMGIDAVIVQDIGFAAAIHKLMPDLDLHASTQMSIYNANGVNMLSKLGFKRIVLARELSIEEMKNTAGNTDLQLEVFIHGALCISYSGQCLMSSFNGGRSGNRGQCAQPCRLPYQYERNDGKSNAGPKAYLLSPKDLCSIDNLKELINSGVGSLKIEGRMKSPEYVATVTRIYRKYIDNIYHTHNSQVEDIDRDELMQIFNRGGFSSGYLLGKMGRDMMSWEKPKNWGIYLGEVLSYNVNKGWVKLELKQDISIGDGIEIWTGENRDPGTIVTYIRRFDGKAVDAAKAGEIVELGDLKSIVDKGDKIYRTSQKKLTVSARQTFEGVTAQRVSLIGQITIKENENIVFSIKDFNNNVVNYASGIMPEKAINRALTIEKVEEQIAKTGGTPFKFDKIVVNLGDNLALPASKLNDIRRSALDELSELRINKYKRAGQTFSEAALAELLKEKHKQAVVIENDTNEVENETNVVGNDTNNVERNNKISPRISLQIYKPNKLQDYSMLGTDNLYLPFSAFLDKNYIDTLLDWKRKGLKIFIWIPSITKGNYDELLEKRLPELINLGFKSILVSNPGTLKALEKYSDLELFGDYSLNVYNSYSVRAVNELNIRTVTVSPELSLEQLLKISEGSTVDIETIVYGHIPVMTTEFCVANALEGESKPGKTCACSCQDNQENIRDIKGAKFEILTDKIDCRSSIMSAEKIQLYKQSKRLKQAGIKSFRICVLNEDEEEIRQIIKACR